MKVDWHAGPHIFMLGIYWGGKERALWISLPFFMVKLTRPTRRI